MGFGATSLSLNKQVAQWRTIYSQQHIFWKKTTSLRFASPHRHRLLLARLMSPVSSADQVRVGSLQGHRSRVTAQNPNHSGGQLLNPRNYRTHSWTEYGVINGAKWQTIWRWKTGRKPRQTRRKVHWNLTDNVYFRYVFLLPLSTSDW